MYRATAGQVARADVETWDYNIDGAVRHMKFEHFIFVLKYLLYLGVLLFYPLCEFAKSVEHCIFNVDKAKQFLAVTLFHILIFDFSTI